MTIRFADIGRKAASAVAALALSSVFVTAAVGYAAAPRIEAPAHRAVA